MTTKVLRPPATAGPREPRDVRRDWIAMLGIFVVFNALYAVSIGVGKRNLEWYNFVMDADPGRVLGDALRGQNLNVMMRHPLFALTIGAVARALQVVAEPRASVLYAVALLSAGGVAAAFLFFRLVCARFVTAMLLTVLYGFAATTWVLSSIPETFAISSGMIILMMLMQRPEFAQPRRHPWRFMLNAVVAALAVGIAVPNIVYAALGFASNLRVAQATMRRRIAVFAAYGASSFIVFATFGIIQRALFSDRVVDHNIYAAPIVAAITDPYLRLDREFRRDEAGRLIRAFTIDNLLAPAGVVEVVRAPDGPQHMIQYDGRTSPLYLITASALLAFVVAIALTAQLRRVSADRRAQFALAVIVYNIGFHFFYRANGQPFIFTMHSLFPLIVLLALVYETSSWRPRGVALAAMVALVVWNNAVFVSFVNRALAKECVTPVGNVCLAWAPPVDSARFSGGVQEFLRSADYPFELGRVAFAKDQFDQSIPLFQRALSLDQDYVLAQLYLGSALIHTNRIDEAIAYLNECLRRRPSNDDLQRLLVVAQRASKS